MAKETEDTDLYALLLIMKLKFELMYEKEEIEKLIKIVYEPMPITKEEQKLLDKALTKYNKRKTFK